MVTLYNEHNPRNPDKNSFTLNQLIHESPLPNPAHSARRIRNTTIPAMLSPATHPGKVSVCEKLTWEPQNRGTLVVEISIEGQREMVYFNAIFARTFE